MRRLLVTLSALTLLVAGPVRANPSPANMLLINPGDLLSGVVSLEYERALTTWFGLTAGLSVGVFRGPLVPLGQPAYLGLGPEFGARFHFIRNAPGGLWLGPSISAGYLYSNADGTLARVWSWGIGAAIGYNFVIGQHFTVQIGAGGRFTDYGDRLVWSPRLMLGLGAVF